MHSALTSHQPESIRAMAARLGLTLGEASRQRSLEIVRGKITTYQSAIGLALLTVIFFGIGFAAACHA